jgi:transposase
MSGKEKILKAWMLRSQGLRVETIARTFKVSERTVYRWLAQRAKDFREQFEEILMSVRNS